jgi:hypothetical protein
MEQASPDDGRHAWVLIERNTAGTARRPRAIRGDRLLLVAARGAPVQRLRAAGFPAISCA